MNRINDVNLLADLTVIENEQLAAERQGIRAINESILMLDKLDDDIYYSEGVLESIGNFIKDLLSGIWKFITSIIKGILKVLTAPFDIQINWLDSNDNSPSGFGSGGGGGGSSRSSSSKNKSSSKSKSTSTSPRYFDFSDSKAFGSEDILGIDFKVLNCYYILEQYLNKKFTEFKKLKDQSGDKDSTGVKEPLNEPKINKINNTINNAIDSINKNYISGYNKKNKEVEVIINDVFSNTSLDDIINDVEDSDQADTVNIGYDHVDKILADVISSGSINTQTLSLEMVNHGGFKESKINNTLDLSHELFEAIDDFIDDNSGDTNDINKEYSDHMENYIEIEEGIVNLSVEDNGFMNMIKNSGNLNIKIDDDILELNDIESIKNKEIKLNISNAPTIEKKKEFEEFFNVKVNITSFGGMDNIASSKSGLKNKIKELFKKIRGKDDITQLQNLYNQKDIVKSLYEKLEKAEQKYKKKENIKDEDDAKNIKELQNSLQNDVRYLKEVFLNGINYLKNYSKLISISKASLLSFGFLSRIIVIASNIDNLYDAYKEVKQYDPEDEVVEEFIENIEEVIFDNTDNPKELKVKSKLNL